MNEISTVKEYVENVHQKSGAWLLKFRLWVFSLEFLFLLVITYVSFSIDFTGAKDPNVRLYQHQKWSFITLWFNIISLGYTPICIYCDWRELRLHSDMAHVKFLNRVRFVCFTSILYPITNFADLSFWVLWVTDRELLAPKSVDVLAPMWLQHALHTFTICQVFLDLILVPRRRPKNLKFGARVLALFYTIYCCVVALNMLHGSYIYPFLRRHTGFSFIPLVALGGMQLLFFFTLQWHVIDYVWGPYKTHTL